MNKLLAPAFAALFLAQILPATILAWRQTRRLEEGRAVTLAVTTRDPRDLMRGEYSALAYEIGRLDRLATPQATPGCESVLARNGVCSLSGERAVYLRLAPDAAGVHRATEALLSAPTDGGLFIAGRMRDGRLSQRGAQLGGQREPCAEPLCLTGTVTYGIESWYGPQGRPAVLDRAARGDVLVEARLDADGAALLDGVSVGGQPFARTARLW